MPSKDKEEDDGSRLDRELMELLQELRVVLPGIQVLFAFLLTVPFAQGFGRLDSGQRAVFFAAFIVTSVSSILLLAPSVQHWLRWRRFDKERLLQASHRLAIVGVFLMAVAIAIVVYLVADVLYGVGEAAAAAAVVAATVVVVWWIAPLVRSLRGTKRGPTEGSAG